MAGALLLIESALFEPARLCVQHWLGAAGGQAVGGVGGVGGLVNLWSPAACPDATATTPYCFHRGLVAGLTPFALVVVLGWGALPLLLPAVLRLRASLTPAAFLRLWRALSALWFALPLAVYLWDPFYRSCWRTAALAVAIAAAFPLSWHLSLVALPVGHAVALPLLGWRRADAARCHKSVGWSAAGWAAVHAGGELLFLGTDPASGFLKAFDLAARCAASAPRPPPRVPPSTPCTAAPPRPHAPRRPHAPTPPRPRAPARLRSPTQRR